MENEEEMQRLKMLYDELWQDAKTLIRDMKESIGMYQLSGGLLLGFALMSFFWVTVGSLFRVLTGSTELLNYFNVFFGVAATLFFSWVGLRLLRWHSRLKERYAKLLQMEKDIED